MSRPRYTYGLLALAITSPISLGLTNAAFVVTLIAACIDWRAGRFEFRRTPLDSVIGIWIAASLLSAMTSIDPVESLRDVRNQGLWLITTLIVAGICAGESARRLAFVWVAASVVASGQAWLQVTLGWELLPRSTSGIVRGFFSGHLPYAHLTVVELGLAFALLTDARSPRERWGLLGAIGAIGGALAATGARGAWLALLVVGVAWVIRSRQIGVLVLLLVLAAGQIGFAASRPGGVASFLQSFVATDRASALVTVDDLHSNLWRLDMWSQGLRMFGWRPELGLGVEVVGEISRDFRGPVGELGVSHLHSNYFEILVTRGFFGLTAYLYLLLHSGIFFWRHAVGPGRALAFLGFAAIAAHAVHGLTYFSMGSAPIQLGTYVTLGIAAGAIVARHPPGALGPVVQIGASEIQAVLIAVTCALLGRPLQDAAPFIALGGASILLAHAVWLASRQRLGPAGLALVGALAVPVAGAMLLLGGPLADPTPIIRVVAAAAWPFCCGYAALQALRWARARCPRTS